MAQLSYGYKTPSGIPGGKADLNMFEKVATRRIENEDGLVKFGVAVFKGTELGCSVKLGASGSTKDDFEGIVLNGGTVEHDLNGEVIVRKDSVVGVMQRGRIWARLSPEAAPEYKKKAYVVVDGDYNGCFTDQSAAYSAYEPCESADDGAKEIVDDSTGSPTGTQIKLASVTPVVAGYEPKVGDYVVSKQIHGATVDVGATFGEYADVENGIAIVQG